MSDTLLNILSLFSIPAVFTILGLLFCLWIPKNRNGCAGYRTNRSRKSEAAWIFANKLSAKLMLILGLTELVIFIIVRLAFGDLSITACSVILGIEVILVIVPVLITESQLKENFDENGEPKQK